MTSDLAANSIPELRQLRLGYKPTHAAVEGLLRSLPPVVEPKPIASLCVGEHVAPEVAQDVCDWMTACLYRRMTPKAFQALWDSVCDTYEEHILWTRLLTIGELHWKDDDGSLEGDEGEVSWLYETAFTKGADRFGWTDQDAFMSIVALRGEVTIDAIEECANTLNFNGDPI